MQLQMGEWVLPAHDAKPSRNMTSTKSLALSFAFRSAHSGQSSPIPQQEYHWGGGDTLLGRNTGTQVRSQVGGHQGGEVMKSCDTREQARQALR
jgi:hypothetical protein